MRDPSHRFFLIFYGCIRHAKTKSFAEAPDSFNVFFGELHSAKIPLFCVYHSTKYVTRGDAIYNMVLLEKPITVMMIAAREMAGIARPLYICNRISY